MKTNIFAILILALSQAHVFAAGQTIVRLDYPGSTNTLLGGIENNVVVGYYSNTSFYIPSHGFIFDGTSFSTLDFPGSTSTVLNDISNGSIVGSYMLAGLRHGFVYDSGVFTTVDHPLTSTSISNGCEVLGISGNKIVGDYIDDGGVTHAYLYDGATFTTLTTPYSSVVGAVAIDGDNIVGSYGIGAINHGYKSDGVNYTMIDHPLGVQGTYPQGIFGNLIVGGYFDAANSAHAFLFDGTTYSTLDVPPTVGLSSLASGIFNNTIVGYTVDSRGRYHGFITIPEPATAGLFLMVLLWLSESGRGRRKEKTHRTN